MVYELQERGSMERTFPDRVERPQEIPLKYATMEAKIIVKDRKSAMYQEIKIFKSNSSCKKMNDLSIPNKVKTKDIHLSDWRTIRIYKTINHQRWRFFESSKFSTTLVCKNIGH